MFSMLNPPLLVQPVNKESVSLFPVAQGYQVHPLENNRALVCFRDGWTIPLSVEQQSCVAGPPLLMVKNSGSVTVSAGTTTKGYAHVFCREDGRPPEYAFKERLFPEQNDYDWMFINDTVTMIWFQYGNKNQYLGDSGFDMDRIYYGKLLIRSFTIKEDIAPGLNKYADYAARQNKQLRVESQQLYLGGWNVQNGQPGEYLRQLLASNGLERYDSAIATALDIASAQPA